MLKEQKSVRQIEGEPQRRWFTGDDIDLIVWVSDFNDILGFELCYGLKSDPRAFRWTAESGYSHVRVDEGAARPGKIKGARIAGEDHLSSIVDMQTLFKIQSADLPEKIRECIEVKIKSLQSA